jgi:hypothetical protein
MQQTVEKLTAEMVSKVTTDLQQKVSHMEEENKSLSRRINDLEISSRTDNLIIHGFPEPTNTQTSIGNISQPQPSETISSPRDELPSFLEFCNTHLGLSLKDTDVSYLRRLPPGPNKHCRPILVRFSTRRTRDTVYFARKILWQSSSYPGHTTIYINEHLTKTSAHIYSASRKMVREKKIHSSWSSGGLIFVRRTNSTEDRPKKIESLDDLRQFDTV